MFDVTCLDSFGNVVNTFTQWDINQTLYIEDSGFDIAPIFHFCNQNTEKALCVQSEFNPDHVLTVKVPNQLLIEPYPITVYVYMGSGDAFKTVEYLRFPLRPRPQPHDFLFAENVEVVWLQDLIQEVKELNEVVTEAETERVQNENIRITNETTRIQAEKEREAAEALRKKSENERNAAENLRKENEKNREASEASRNQNENERKAKESERQTAEGVRESNEDTRLSNENERLQNESDRQDAEKIRQANEDTRCSNEDTREQKESERQAAEAERSTKESSRSEAETKREEAETARTVAEASRENAETARNDAEQKRADNENARQDSESQRETDENTRKDSEKQRIETENKRAENEVARITAETARDDAESIREANEQQRIANESTRNDAEAERIAEFDRMTDAINDKIAEANQVIEDNGNAKSNADAAAASAKEASAYKDDAASSAADAEYWSKQAQAASNVEIAEVGKPGIVSPDGKTITITPDGVITGVSSEFIGTKAEYEAAVAANQIEDNTLIFLIDGNENDNINNANILIDKYFSLISTNPLENKQISQYLTRLFFDNRNLSLQAPFPDVGGMLDIREYFYYCGKYIPSGIYYVNKDELENLNIIWDNLPFNKDDSINFALDRYNFLIKWEKVIKNSIPSLGVVNIINEEDEEITDIPTDEEITDTPTDSDREHGESVNDYKEEESEGDYRGILEIIICKREEGTEFIFDNTKDCRWISYIGTDSSLNYYESSEWIKVGSGGSTASNPNLFINPDFSIRERNETPKISGNYFIDRWKFQTNYSTMGDITLGENYGITLHSYHSSISSKLTDIAIHQKIDYITKTKFSGTTFTWTIKVSAVTGEWVFYENSSGDLSKTISTAGIHSFTWTPTFNTRDYLNLTVSSICGQECEITIDWMKLEIGNVATPYIPPNPAEELLKCQRYYEVGSVTTYFNMASNNSPIAGTVFKVTKRTSPTITIKNNKIYPANYESDSISVTISSTTTNVDGICYMIGTDPKSNFTSGVAKYEYTADAEIY